MGPSAVMEKQENECACFPGEEPAVVEFATTSTHAAARLAASRALREDGTPLGPRAGCGCPTRALTSPAPALGGLPGLLAGSSARQSHLRQGPRCWFSERRTSAAPTGTAAFLRPPCFEKRPRKLFRIRRRPRGFSRAADRTRNALKVSRGFFSWKACWLSRFVLLFPGWFKHVTRSFFLGACALLFFSH